MTKLKCKMTKLNLPIDKKIALIMTGTIGYGKVNLIIDEILNEYGRPVDVVDINGTLVVRKTFQKRKDNIIKPPKEELNKKEILVVSDTHYGSICNRRPDS